MNFAGARIGCLGLAVVAWFSACDAPVKDRGPIPPAQIAAVQAALLPVDGATIGPTPICPKSCDDGNPCTQDFCFDGFCESKAVVDGAGCADNDPCTFAEQCFAGRCQVKTSFCPADQCNTAMCDGRGGCTKTPKTGQACNDGMACTYGETCDSNGVCSNGRAVVCQSSDCVTRVCNGTATCATTIRAGTACDDTNPCTYGDLCDATGACRPAGTVVCQNDACNDRRCNGTATCATTPKPGQACNDGNACTYGDKCDAAGACQGGATLTCVNDACNLRTCNGGPTCKVTPRTGNRCDDSNACTHGDTCNGEGACAGTPIVCMSDETAERSCNGGPTCTVKPRPGVACDDGDPCTQGDVRLADGSCKGTPYSCAVGACVVSSVCDGSGGCRSVFKPDETACDADQSQCTPHDVCRAGVCVPDPRPVKCIERDCNTVTCNAATGNCEYQPTSGGTCGVSGCFSTGTCQNGVCSGQPKDCSAFTGPCTEGLCDAATGACVAAAKPNGSDCSPKGACSAVAVCAFGVCELQPGACPAASSPCKVAACDPAGGACIEVARPAGAPCDPQNSCISEAACDASGACIGTPASNGDPCTAAGGQIGQCFAGTCQASGAPLPAPGGTPDAGSPDAPATSPPGAKPAPPKQSGCSAVPADARGPRGLFALAVLGLVAGLRRCRPRRRG